MLATEKDEEVTSVYYIECVVKRAVKYSSSDKRFHNMPQGGYMLCNNGKCHVYFMIQFPNY